MLVRKLSVFWHTSGGTLGILQTNEDFQGVTSCSSILSRRLRPKSFSRDICPYWRATSGTCCLHGGSKMFCKPSWLICQRRQLSWSMTGRRRFACHLVRMKPVTCGMLSRNMPSAASAARPSTGKLCRVALRFSVSVRILFCMFCGLSSFELCHCVLHCFCPRDIIILGRPTTSFWQKCENKLPKPPTAWLMPFSPSCQRHNPTSSFICGAIAGHIFGAMRTWDIIEFCVYKGPKPWFAHFWPSSMEKTFWMRHLEPLADLSKKLHWSALFMTFKTFWEL